MDGVINVNKPFGMTSSDVVVAIKRKLKMRRVGHMGTLDPIGTGVLLIGVGLGARLFDYYLKKDKTYVAEFEFGLETDTLDNTGVITKTTAVMPTIDDIKKSLPSLIGEVSQMPPIYSAKSVNGVRAYDLARQGIAVELKPVNVSIYDIKYLECTGENKYLFEISCSSGTYIRSICRDMGYAVGSYATMNSICRTKCGDFLNTEAVELDDIDESKLLQMTDVINLQKYELDSSFYKQITNGVRVKVDNTPSGSFQLFCNGEFFGIANYDNGITITTYLRNAT